MNQVKGNIPRCGTICKIVNKNDLYYQCSKYGTNLLFEILRIRDKIDKPFTPVKRNSLPDKYHKKKSLNKTIKIRKLNRKRHKATRINDLTYQKLVAYNS